LITNYINSPDNSSQYLFLEQIPLTTQVNNLQSPNKLGLFVQNIAHVKPT
jgi:hypothetical protein